MYMYYLNMSYAIVYLVRLTLSLYSKFQFFAYSSTLIVIPVELNFLKSILFTTCFSYAPLAFYM